MTFCPVFPSITTVTKSEPLTFRIKLTKMVLNQEKSTAMIIASFYLKVKYQSFQVMSVEPSPILNLKDNRRNYRVFIQTKR